MRSIGREERSRPTDSCNTYLLRLYDALRPRHESFVWSGWVLAIALLGLETLSDVVRRAFGRGLCHGHGLRALPGGSRANARRSRAHGGLPVRQHRAAGGRGRGAVPLVRLLGRGQAGPGAAVPGRGLRPAAAGAGLQSVQARRPQRPLPVRQREEVQEVLPVPGVDPVGRRLAVSASTLTRRDPATTVTSN